VKNTKKMDAAKKLIDWVATKEANEAYSKNFAIVSHPDVKPALAFIPADLEKRLVKNDFAWAAKNRDRILAEWQKRYAAKTEK
jgi:iron(III) transport system substrate-binding protein